MRVVSRLLRHVVYPGLSHSGLLRYRPNTSPAVLTYHGVLPECYEPIDRDLDGNLVTAKRFREQLAFLKTYYTLISPEEFLGWARNGTVLPGNAVLLTCDDGLQNNCAEMLPILQEFGAKCLFFVTGDAVRDPGCMLWHERLCLRLLRTPSPFDLQIEELAFSLKNVGEDQKRAVWQQLLDSLSKLDANSRISVLREIDRQLKSTAAGHSKYRNSPAQSARFLTMSLLEIRQLIAGGMTIGAHSISHPKLSHLTSDELVRAEISGSRDVLERTLEQEIWAFAYPFGDTKSVSHREIRFAQEAGFTCAFRNSEGEVGDDLNLFALPRIHITSDVTCGELDARISGVHASLRRLLA